MHNFKTMTLATFYTLYNRYPRLGSCKAIFIKYNNTVFATPKWSKTNSFFNQSVLPPLCYSVSYPHCAILSVLPPLCYSQRPTPTVLLSVSYPHCATLCPTLTVLLSVSYPHCATLGVLPPFYYSECPTLTMLL